MVNLVLSRVQMGNEGGFLNFRWERLKERIRGRWSEGEIMEGGIVDFT